MDTGKAKSELGWSPKYTSAETLAALAAVFRVCSPTSANSVHSQSLQPQAGSAAH